MRANGQADIRAQTVSSGVRCERPRGRMLILSTIPTPESGDYMPKARLRRASPTSAPSHADVAMATMFVVMVWASLRLVYIGEGRLTQPCRRPPLCSRHAVASA
jgi:hypothetical protein